MRRFQFRLESLRRLRAAREEERKRAFAEASKAYRKELEKLEELLARERSAREEMASRMASGCRREELMGMREFLECLSLSIRSQRERVREARERLEEERRLLVEASRERKVVDKLHERALERYRYEAARQEQGFLDEVAGTRFLTGESPLYEGRALWREEGGA